jgi:hypothetical protein
LKDFFKYIPIFSLLKRRRVGKSIFTFVPQVSNLKFRDFSFLHKQKGKAIPLQALTGPEGSRRLRLPDFKTIGT